MSKALDLIHTSRLEVELRDNHVHQTVRKHRHVKTTEIWERERKLGAGGFATVYLERCREHEHKVRAVKQLAKSGGVDYNRELEAAALFSQQLYEGCFVKSFGWYESPDFVYLTMEYLPLGDLQQHMGSAFPESEARLIIGQVLEGLNHMHERDFTHRDLKPANILICETGPQWWVKLADFGISKRAVDGVSGLRTHIYTPQFVAPEVLYDSEQYTRAVDIWSLGVIAFLLLSGERTVFRTSPDLLRYWSSGNGLPMEKLLARSISDDGQRFVSLLLSPRPQDRPDVTACLEHAWLATASITIRSFRALPTESSNTSEAATAFAPWTTIDEKSSSATRDNPYPEFPSEPIESPQDSGIGRSSLPISDAASVNLPAAGKSDQLTASTSILSTHKKPSEEKHTHKVSTPEIKSVNEYAISGMREVSVTVVARTSIHWAGVKRLEGHSSEVWAVAFSPDGRLVGSGSDDRTVRLWDVATGAEVKRLEGHSSAVWAVAFSPDGRLVGSGSRDRTVRLWDVATRAEVKRLEGHSSGVWAVAFSPDGRLVGSGSRDRTVRLWDVATGAEVKRLEGHSSRVGAVAFSPDGRLVGSGSDDRTVRL